MNIRLSHAILLLVVICLAFGLMTPSSRARRTEPLVYAAKLSQSDTDDPVATVFKNTLGGEVVWHRNVFDAGVYYGELEDAFPATTYLAAPVRDSSGDITTGSAVVFTIDRGGDNAVYINSYGTPEDGSLQRRDIEGSIFVKIEVY